MESVKGEGLARGLKPPEAQIYAGLGHSSSNLETS